MSATHDRADAAGGRAGWRPAALGVGLALPFIPMLLLAPDGALDLLALLLAATAGVYLGFAINDGRRAVFWTELAIAGATFFCAVLGLWWSAGWVAVGFLGHAVWDVLHHFRGIGARVRPSYPPFCAVFDAAVAVLVLALG